MTNQMEGVEQLREAIDRVAADLPVRPPVFAAAAPSPKRHAWRGSPAMQAALAAGMVFAVLAYPAFRGLTRQPAAGEAVSPRAEAGPVDLHVVSLPRRAADTRSLPVDHRASLEIGENRPWILLVEVNPEWLTPGQAESYELRILNADGGEAMAWDLETAEVHRWAEAHQGIPLLLPVGTLTAGFYELRFSRRSADAQEVLSSLDMEVVWAP